MAKWRVRTMPLRAPWLPTCRFCLKTVPPSRPRWSPAKADFMVSRLVWLAALLGMSSVTWAASRPEVVIDPGGVPPAALAAINGAVEAITRLAEDQDGGEVERLRRRANDAAVSALETQGYFSSVVTLEVGQDYMGETWDIIIEPGPRTAVRNVDLRFQGQVATPDFEHRVQNARQVWPLKAGQTFINSEWSNAKTTLLDEINTRDFYFARITHSQATIHAEEAHADPEVDRS